MTNFFKPVYFVLFYFSCLKDVSGQSALRKIPEIQLKNLNGENVNSTGLLNKDGLTVISFWATWCKPCILELSSMKELYSNWQKETNVKIVAVSIDDSRNNSKVGPLVNGKGWLYDIALDANGDFKRALNVNNIPHTFLLNANGEILWQHNSYAPGDEDDLFELIKKYTPKK